MSKVKKESLPWWPGAPERWYFYCPGCIAHWNSQPNVSERMVMLHALHVVNVQVHGFNRNAESPTFTPSILVTNCGRGYTCHSFVENGVIRYLGDCTHPLANQNVELPVIEYDPYEEDNLEREARRSI